MTVAQVNVKGINMHNPRATDRLLQAFYTTQRYLDEILNMSPCTMGDFCAAKGVQLSEAQKMLCLRFPYGIGKNEVLSSFHDLEQLLQKALEHSKGGVLGFSRHFSYILKMRHIYS